MKSKRPHTILATLLCLFVIVSARGQYTKYYQYRNYGESYNDVLGPESIYQKTLFILDSVKTEQYKFHYLGPKGKNVLAYNTDGKKVKLRSSEIYVTEIYTGSYLKRKNVSWVKVFDAQEEDYYLYVPLDDLIDLNKHVDPVKEAASIQTARVIFFSAVLPAIALLFFTIFLLKNLYLQIQKSTRYPILGVLLIPFLPLIFFGKGVVKDFFKFYEVDMTMKITEFGQLGFRQIFYQETILIVTVIAAIFFIWIGVATFLFMLAAIPHMGTPARAHGTSFDGGRTIYIDSITPGTPGTPMSPFAKRNCLIIAFGLFPPVWLVYLAAVLPVVTIISIYRLVTRKKLEFKSMVTTYTTSFLGFAYAHTILLFIAVVIQLAVPFFEKLGQ